MKSFQPYLFENCSLLEKKERERESLCNSARAKSEKAKAILKGVCSVDK